MFFNCKERFYETKHVGRMKVRKPNIINSMRFHNPRLQHRQTGYISVTRQHIQEQYVLVAVTLVLERGSNANTCKKSLTDGVNEDSDYLFRVGQERVRAKTKRDRKLTKITGKSLERREKLSHTLTVLKSSSHLRQKMSQHDSLHVFRQLFSSCRLRG